MSKVNQIQLALKEIDQARFQKLCDAYLRRLGYDNINPLGSVIGKDKVRPGTPDTFVPLPNGKYLFAEYTTQQGGIGAKFEEDLLKCFDVDKTSVPPDEIESIVLCCNSLLDVEEDRKLRKICVEHGCSVDIYGIGKLSHDLAERYPELAKEYLGIDVDTGQIVEEERFISVYQKHPNATRIDTAFLGREDDLASALSKLDIHNVLLISGRPGVGKTRLAIECSRRFAESHPGFEIRYIRNLGADLFNDLRITFTPPGKYLIVIDDANRLAGGLEYVLSLLPEAGPDRQIKVICTVRDYAHDKVQMIAKGYTVPAEMEVNAFTHEEIKALVSAEYSIHNNYYLERITRLAEGNPRIAMMAASVAHEHQTLESINNVASLYDQYFESIANEVAEANNRDLWRVAGVIMFFRNVNSSNNEQMEIIHSIFGIEPESFWQLAHRLHDLEIVDMYEDGTLVRIADQVLATYLFYRVAFRERLLDLSPVLKGLFPRFRQHLVDAINPVISAFDGRQVKDVLKPSVIAALDQFEHEGERGEWWELMGDFWWIDETKVLRNMRDVIHMIEPESVAIGSIKWKPNSAVPHGTPLSVLQHLRWSSNPEIAIALILEYARRRPSVYDHVVHILTDDYGFCPDSYGYWYERLVIDAIWEQWEKLKNIEAARLLVAVASDFIKIHHVSTGSHRRNSISIAHFELVATPELREFRRVMLARLFELYKIEELRASIVHFLMSYPSEKVNANNAQILAWDMEGIFPFMLDNFTKQYSECIVVHKLLNQCRRQGVPCDPSIGAEFYTATYSLSRFLHDDRSYAAGYSAEERRLIRNDAIRNRFESYSMGEYREFFAQCNEILSTRERDHEVRRQIHAVLIWLCTHDPKLFVLVVKWYLADGDRLQLNPQPLVQYMIEALGVEETLDVIAQATGENQDSWRFSIYPALSVAHIEVGHLDKLSDLYRSASCQSMPFTLSYLAKYLHFDPEFVTRIVEILINRANDEFQFLGALMGLFFGDEEDLRLLTAIDIDVLKRAYLATAKVRDHMDHDGRSFDLILDRNPSFLREYMKFRHEQSRGRWWHEDRDYDFIWNRSNYKDIIRGGLEEAFALAQEDELSLDDMREALLRVSSSEHEELLKISEKRVTLLEEVICERYADKEYMSFLFDGIAYLDEDTRRRLLVCFLRYNKDIDGFERLSLNPRSGSATGSWVPVYAKYKEFVESLLPLTNTIDLLDHREYLERVIEGWDRSIDREKRSDFLRD